MAAYKRALVYVVASPDEEAVLRQEIETYCASKDIRVAEWLIEEPIAKLTALRDRPVGARIITTMGKRRIRHLILPSLSNAFGDHMDAVHRLTSWRKKAVHLVSSRIILEDGDEKTAVFMAALRQAEAIAKGNRSIRYQTGVAKRKVLGEARGLTSFGYDLVEGHYVENPDEQRTIALAKKLHQRGLKLQAIADELNGRGIKSKKGKKWHPKTVQGLIFSTQNNHKAVLKMP